MTLDLAIVLGTLASILSPGATSIAEGIRTTWLVHQPLWSFSRGTTSLDWPG